MGWKTKLMVALLGVFFLGGGLWPVGLLCFLYLLFPGRSRKEKPASEAPRRRARVSVRHVLGLVFFLLAGMAVAAGGVLSPLAFLAVGSVVLAWPLLRSRVPLGDVEPVKDSVLLRSKYIPLAWHVVAELKPGAESFPRAVASFEGRLAVFTETGKTYLLASCKALDRREAESKLLHALQSACPRRNTGAYLLPLGAGAASEVFKLKLSRVRVSDDYIADPTPGASGMLLLDCVRGAVTKAAAFAVEGESSSPRVPSGTSVLESPPLVWEVFDSIGRRTPWPDPDGVSNLLDSLAATKGAPLGERLKSLEGEGAEFKVESLASDQLRLTRPQLRAIVSIYS